MKKTFKYQGGKFRHLEWLLPLLPENPDVFVDVFGGSGVVLRNRKPVHHEIFNDLDEDLVTFFRVLRENCQPLLDSLSMTPFSRKEFEVAAKKEERLSDLETARRFFVRVSQGFGGRPHNASWISKVPEDHYRPQIWRRYPTQLAQFADRLLNVRIECAPALEVIRRYDTPDTLFYCDPPYSGNVSWTDRYLHEMSDDDHRELADTLKEITGKAAVSGYRSALYDDDLYADWQRTDGRPRIAGQGEYKAIRQECLWTNYDPAEHARERLLPFA